MCCAAREDGENWLRSLRSSNYFFLFFFFLLNWGHRQKKTIEWDQHIKHLILTFETAV